jgi:predicted nuclease with TOPRIM domain
VSAPANTDGLRAGNITIRALEIESSPTDRPRFVLNGGPAPSGQTGEAGLLKTPFEDMALFAEMIGSGAPQAPARLEEAEVGPLGFSWLHPIAVRATLGYAKDLYFPGFLTEAKECFTFYKDYLGQLGQFNNLPELIDTNSADLEFAELENDIDRHLARLADGLDYYGNPAGWVPLLSFEVNFLLTDNLIDQAIRSLYVSYWLTRSSDYLQNQETALREAEDQLQQENALLRNRMAELVGNPDTNTPGLLDELLAEESALQSKLDTLGEKLAVVEERLLAQAEDLQKKEDRKAAIKKGVRVMGAVMQVIPVGQPALAAAGGGLDLLTRVDEQSPLDSVVQGISIAGTYKVSKLQTQAKDLDEKMNPPVFGPLTEDETKRQEYQAQAEQIEGGLNLVQQGSDELQKFLQSNEAPLDAVQAKLEKLKKENAQFQEIAEEIEEVTIEKQAFTARLITIQNEIRELPGLIMKNALAAQQINNSASQLGGVLDPQALSVIEEIERRAKDRLRRQFYLLAKAYEYRLVENYLSVGGQAFDAVAVFLKIVAIIEAAEGNAVNPADDEIDATEPATPHIINPAGFDTLKEVFRNQLQVVADRIIDDYPRLGREFSRETPTTLNFNEDQLALLNGDFRKVTVNFQKEGLLGINREMHRIRDLSLSDVQFSLTLDGQPTTAEAAGLAPDSFLEIQVLHTGRSVLKKDGRSYVFNHYVNQSTEQNPIKWVFELDLLNGTISPNPPSFASESLLTSLLREDGSLDIQRFSRPGANADLAICVLSVSPQWVGAPQGNLGVQIEGLSLEAGIDYFETGGLPETEILVQDENGNPLSITPRFLFDPVTGDELPEVIGRRDGVGDLTRSFNVAQFEVRPEAFFGNELTLGQAQPNGFEFSHWLSQQGGRITHTSEGFNPLGDYLKASSDAGNVESQILVVENRRNQSNSNKRFIAVYRFTGDTEAAEVEDILLDPSQSDQFTTTYLVDFSEDVGGVDADDFLAMNGNQMLSVTSTSRVGRRWQVQVAGQPTFFALIDDDSILDDAGNSLAGRGDGNGNFEYDDGLLKPAAPILSLSRFLPDGSPVLRITGPITSMVSLSWSPDLTEGSWQELTTLNLSEGALDYPDTRDDLTSKGFYRIEIIE